MSSCSNTQPAKLGDVNHQNTFPSTEFHESSVRRKENGVEVEVEEEEEDDADFNPFLKEIPSQEASSSLSSEVDGLDGDVVDSGVSVGKKLSKRPGEVRICNVGGSEHGEEEILMQATNGTSEKELKKKASFNKKKRKAALISQPEVENNQERYNGLSSEIDNNDVIVGELSDSTKFRKPIVETDNEDAICTRTRARYSLSSFTLDELETFLQETDDDDDLQNVDDEEEYKKFLAAVLLDGDGDCHSIQDNENVDDEDEDNDADFEIELEELLESEPDENAAISRKVHDRFGRRPETRQNRRQKVSSQCENKLLGLVKRPLRPLLPSLPNGPIVPRKTLMPETATSCLSSTTGYGLINGFTPQQIAQLHILIHEHVQLLIQVFSLCILDPSRQHVASQVQGLIFEMVRRRDELLASKTVPYPSICFSPSYVCSSVSDGASKFIAAQCNIESAPTSDAQRVCFPPPNQSHTKGRCDHASNRQQSSFQNVDGSFWLPYIRGPVLSILDVAPLNLVGRFVDDVYTAVLERRQRYMESSSDTCFEKEPLFPLPSSPPEANCEGSTTVATAVNVVSTSPCQQQPKKTLAAVLVENTKKQSIALVPKEIAKLAQIFFPLFSPVLFPRKPPPAAVVNRILFTDSEDELLALGLMEYNTDWKAIQQRFLPCKSKHQIFVRQKNRCSSKAPENPIKAVRRMKTSPLTEEELARIQEGLKVYNFDWKSVWQFIVPHRDISLLQRQWRIALGTQRSYKNDAVQKEKRRIYESKRRKCRSTVLGSWETVSRKEDYQAEIASRGINVGDNCIQNLGVAYVHQGFLADWRPVTSTCPSSELPCPDSRQENLHNSTLPEEGIHLREQNEVSGQIKPQTGNQHAVLSLSKHTQHPYASSNITSDRHSAPNATEPRHPVSGLNSHASNSKYYCRPYRGRRVNNSHYVKLAPDLPPVNLPPSVRVVSQEAFRNNQCGTSTKNYTAGTGVTDARKDNFVSQIPHAEKLGIIHSGKDTGNGLKDKVTSSRPESGSHRDRCAVAERGNASDLQMHPLLFQASEDGNISYYPLRLSTNTPNSFSFFSGTQPRLNLTLFHNPYQENHVDYHNKSLKSKGSTPMSFGIDFHPLLQKSNDGQFQTSFESIQTDGLLAMATKSSSPNEKSNELDLEMHLSATSRRRKSRTVKDLNACDAVGSTLTVTKSKTAVESQNSSIPCYQRGETFPLVSSRKLASGGHESVIPIDNSRCNMDDIGDQSHPEIVMEQEELSDSEEDFEENVEFECEEMADSEGEDGSECGQILDVQNKVPDSTTEKAAKHAASSELQCEAGDHCDPHVDVSIPENDISHSMNLGLRNQVKDDTSSSWLSLDSCAPEHSSLSKSKHDGDTENRHAIDMEQQLSMGPSAFVMPRKSSNRLGRSTTSLNKVTTVRSSSHDDDKH